MALKRLNTEHLTAIKWLALPNRGGKTFEQIADICGVLLYFRKLSQRL